MKTEAEHLLYYSIPGFFIFFFIYLFLTVTGDTGFLSTSTIALTVAAVFPVGYLVYQAYVRILYDKIWRDWFSVPDPGFELLGKILEEEISSLDDELAKKVRETISRRHVFLFFIHATQKQQILDYRWRLINLVNARGMGIFSSAFATLFPLIYGICLYLSSPTFPMLPTEIAVPNLKDTLRFLSYYLVIAICILVLSSGISRIKKILADLDIGILGSTQENLDESVRAFLSLNTVSEVDRIVSESKKREELQKLVDEAYTSLRKKKWKEAIRKASKAYTLAEHDTNQD